MTREPKTDDIIRIGQWRLQVSGEYVYVHHEAHPGDIQVKADVEGFVVDVYDDAVEDCKATLAVPYDELGPLIGKDER